MPTLIQVPLAALFASLFTLYLVLGQAALGQTAVGQGPAVIDYQLQVVKRYPHDPELFTQGLEIRHGTLFESAGHYGKSQILHRTLDKTQANARHALKKRYFAEGLTVLDDRVYQLTWRAKRGFIYDRNNLKPLGQFSYRGEGWGLCNDGHSLIMSNGSSKLQFLNPETFQVQRSIEVTLNGHPITKLNELEWIDGQIYANIWQSDWIVIIDPTQGHVVGKANLSGLRKAQASNTAGVLNGIAYDKQQQRLFVTGKYWPTLFEIELKPTIKSGP